MILNILSWVVFGLIAGAIARMLLPGRDAMGWLGTILVGIVGSVVGGFLADLIVGNPDDRFHPAGFLGAVIGAIIVLMVLRALRPRRYARP